MYGCTPRISISTFLRSDFRGTPTALTSAKWLKKEFCRGSIPVLPTRSRNRQVEPGVVTRPLIYLRCTGCIPLKSTATPRIHCSKEIADGTRKIHQNVGVTPRLFDLTQGCSIFTAPWHGEKSLERSFLQAAYRRYGGGQGATGRFLNWSTPVGTTWSARLLSTPAPAPSPTSP